MSETATIRQPLAPFHLDELRKSGLSDATIEAARICTEHDPIRLAAIIKWKSWPKKAGQGMVIRFPDIVTGELNGYATVKPQNPEAMKNRDNKGRKYILPRGEGYRAYVPTSTLPTLRDPQRELLITEGPKKALKADQEGFPCIALPGVWGWKDGKKADKLIPDLLQIDWKGKPVYIAYDSDLTENEQVADAESRLAAQLTALGAVVKVIRLPGSDGRSKVGLDDYLIAAGKDALWKLMGDAQEAQPVSGKAERVHADTLDPMVEARRFLRECTHHADGPTLRVHRGSFMGWDDRKYREFGDDEIRAMIYRHLDATVFQIKRPVVGNIMEALRSLVILPSNRERPCWLNRPIMEGRPETKFVAMQNGIVDLEAVLSGAPDALLPHSPNWFSTICLPYPFDPSPFDPKTSCPKWLKAIDRNLEGDAERIGLLQEWAGYSCVPDTSLQKFLAMTGEGGNGKGVVCAGLTSILGTANVSAVSLEMFAVRFQLHSTLGKLANITADSGEFDKAAEGMLKAFTSGDRMQFERKLKDPFEAMPTARLVLATNSLPRFTDRSSGIWRRMILMPFRVTIPEHEKIYGMDKPEWWERSGELSGMFNWAMEGLRRLRRQGGFTDSGVCRRELAEHRLDSNPARQFLESRYVADPQGDVATQEVYAAYVKWCEENGFRHLASNTFGREILRAFPTTVSGKVYSSDGRRVPGYKGVKFQTENVEAF